jgi:adenosyl cobinamide kinase/adenosyl cobinamide phosphate guanylyltransferase
MADEKHPRHWTFIRVTINLQDQLPELDVEHRVQLPDSLTLNVKDQLPQSMTLCYTNTD